MLGYTIDKSIDLLENRVKSLEAGGGGGGATNWSHLSGKPFSTLGDELYNLDGALTVSELSSDKVKLPQNVGSYSWETVSEAVDELAQGVSYIENNLVPGVEQGINAALTVLEQDKQDLLIQGTGITIEDTIISAPEIYSSDERIVGVWVDGRPVYERTFHSTQYSESVSFNLQAEYAWAVDGFCRRSNYILEGIDHPDTGNSIIKTQFGSDVGEFRVRIGSDYSTIFNELYVRVRYVKEV